MHDIIMIADNNIVADWCIGQSPNIDLNRYSLLVKAITAMVPGVTAKVDNHELKNAGILPNFDFFPNASVNVLLILFIEYLLKTEI